MKSIIQDNEEYCYVCQYPLYGAKDKHHIFEGTANRQKSEEDGCFCYCHRVCHRWLHDHPRSMLTFKQRTQRKWQEHYKKTTKDFIKRYGRNYL